jgi:hypothetical protein
MWRVLGVASLMFVAACLDLSAGQCADGRVCPATWRCDDESHTCIPPGCGDGVVAGAEQCDGILETDCTGIGLGFYDPGELVCRSDCTFDTSRCGARCGDRTINGPEVCDGMPPAGVSCIDYGFQIGRLDCSAACNPHLPACGTIGWRTVFSGGQGVLHGIWVTDGGDAFAVGDGGAILRSQGGAWSTMTSGTTADLKAVWGTSATNVLAVGTDGTILHYDGSSWSAMASGTSAALYGVAGTSANEIYAVGEAGTIARFDGASWTVTTEGSRTLYGISARGDLRIVVGSNSTVLRQRDGNWEQMTGLPATGRELRAVWSDGATAFVVGQSHSQERHVVWRYDDSGWVRLEALIGSLDPDDADGDASKRHLHSVWASSDDDVFIASGWGKLWHYNGQRFALHDPRTTRSLHGVAGTGPDHVLAAAAGGSVQQYAGARWIADATGASTNAELTRALRFAGGETIAIGTSGAILEYDGATWVDRSLNTTRQLRTIWASSEEAADATVFIAADLSGLYRGTFGGSFSNVSTSGVLAVWGTSAGDLWLGGNDSRIWRASQASPGTWTLVHDGGSGAPDVRVIWGTSPSDIFAVGEAGLILHYDGATWSLMDTPTTSNLLDIWGTAPDNVFAVGREGALLHYNGVEWRRMTSGTSENLLVLGATAAHDIFAVGTNNTLLHYDGISWTRVAQAAGVELRGVATSQRESWFVGENGVRHRLERACGSRETRCDDAWDDDCDGLANCADPDCADASVCVRGGACPRIAELGCGADTTGSTFTGVGRIDELRCSMRSTPGPEAAYTFSAASNRTVTVTLADLDVELDLAIIGAHAATGACDPSVCLAATALSGTTKQLTFDAVGGRTYYLVVDGPALTAGTFRLSVSCQ